MSIYGVKGLTTLGNPAFWKKTLLEKEKNADNQHFLLFKQYFVLHIKTNSCKPLPNDNILNWFKLRAFAEDKINENCNLFWEG